ncbi:MAG TPA: hypothetical protein VFF69_07485 [Phycisphaerales bacterium]|nr:hypothetical protein [Phycisphaerales bacterium]
MNLPPGHDDPLHRALAEIGPELPEPTAPDAARWLVAQAAAAAPRPSPASRAGTIALAASAAGLLVLCAVIAVQNHRLRERLALATQGREEGVVVPAGRELPPLVAVRFYHPQCDVARAVEPRFEEMQRTHPSEQVLFVSLDISENKESQSAKLAGALDCGFVFSCDGEPVSSGMVVLADTRSRRVIEASHDATDLPELERALDQALMACSAPPPGG